MIILLGALMILACYMSYIRGKAHGADDLYIIQTNVCASCKDKIIAFLED